MNDFQQVRDTQNLRRRRGPVRGRTTIAPKVVYAEGTVCQPGNVMATPGLRARVCRAYTRTAQ